eukprot:1161508-Pelagomonas_calceolata.AAC.11
MADAWAQDRNGVGTFNNELGAPGRLAQSRTPPRTSLSSGADNRPDVGVGYGLDNNMYEHTWRTPGHRTRPD